MAIVIDDLQTERLAQQIAGAQGLSITEVVREGLLSLASLRCAVADRPPLRERLAILAREVDAVPPRTPADPRSDDEILGYDEHGAW